MFKKRLITVLLSVAMLLSAVPAYAYADEEIAERTDEKSDVVSEETVIKDDNIDGEAETEMVAEGETGETADDVSVGEGAETNVQLFALTDAGDDQETLTINEETFPDAGVREWLKAGLEKNDGDTFTVSEAKDADKLDETVLKMTEGNFTGLEKLSGISLSSLYLRMSSEQELDLAVIGSLMSKAAELFINYDLRDESYVSEGLPSIKVDSETTNLRTIHLGLNSEKDKNYKIDDFMKNKNISANLSALYIDSFSPENESGEKVDFSDMMSGLNGASHKSNFSLYIGSCDGEGNGLKNFFISDFKLADGNTNVGTLAFNADIRKIDIGSCNRKNFNLKVITDSKNLKIEGTNSETTNLVLAVSKDSDISLKELKPLNISKLCLNHVTKSEKENYVSGGLPNLTGLETLDSVKSLYIGLNSEFDGGKKIPFSNVQKALTYVYINSFGQVPEPEVKRTTTAGLIGETLWEVPEEDQEWFEYARLYKKEEAAAYLEEKINEYLHKTGENRAEFIDLSEIEKLGQKGSVSLCIGTSNDMRQFSSQEYYLWDFGCQNLDLKGATALKSVEIKGLYCQDIDVSGCENLKTLKLNGLYSDKLLKEMGGITIYVGEKLPMTSLDLSDVRTTTKVSVTLKSTKVTEIKQPEVGINLNGSQYGEIPYLDLNENSTLGNSAKSHQQTVSVPLERIDGQLVLDMGKLVGGSENVKNIKDLPDALASKMDEDGKIKLASIDEMGSGILYNYNVLGNAGGEALLGVFLTYENQKPEVNAVDTEVAQGAVFDPTEGVTVRDVEDGSRPIKEEEVVENTVDTATPGSYEVTYEAKDSGGVYSDRKTIKVTVKADPVLSVIEKINSIGSVTLDSKAAIDGAREAYDSLTDDQKAAVTNIDKLTEAETRYAELVKAEADKEAAEQVDELIGAVGDEITLDSREAIEAARAAYDALTADQKALVKNLGKLTEAEEAYSALVKEQTDKEAAEQVDELIGAVGDEITLDSREAIEAARAAYDALTAEQKSLVTGLDALKAAESKYQELKAAADKEAAAEVDSLIGAIGDDITLGSKESIETARAAYDALSDDQKALVTGLSNLEKAEAQYLALIGGGQESGGLSPEEHQDNAAPKTGDDSSMGYLALIMAACVLNIIIFSNKRKERM